MFTVKYHCFNDAHWFAAGERFRLWLHGLLAQQKGQSCGSDTRLAQEEYVLFADATSDG
jgi:hypothetical protein